MPYNGIPNSKNHVWLLVFLFKGKTMTTLKGYAKNFNLGVHLKVEFNYQTVMMNWFGPKIRLIGSSQPYWAIRAVVVDTDLEAVVSPQDKIFPWLSLSNRILTWG